jgi:hypothetical protein
MIDETGMYDTVNFWQDRAELSGGSPFDILPYLSEITQRQNEQSGYSCTGKILDYTVGIWETGISLKGSLAKSFFGGDNLHTLKRQSVKQALEQVGDHLHIDMGNAKVTRLDISTVLLTRRPPSDYFQYLGDKPRFKRNLAVKDETLYYSNHQRQIAFYDKKKEAFATGMQLPEMWQNSNILRYELRYTKRLGSQLKTDVRGSILYDKEFYYNIIQNWYKEFKAIQKIREASFMTDNIKTPRDAEMAFFAALLQERGQSAIDEYMTVLRANNVFDDPKYYTRVKGNLNTILQSPKGSKSELMQELETEIFNIAKYAR